MLTVRHIEDDGSELIVAAKQVWKTPDDMNLYADVGADSPLRFHTGILYVMNESGATVAKYIPYDG